MPKNPLNSGITTTGLLGDQTGNHPPEGRKWCGTAARHGLGAAKMGLLLPHPSYCDLGCLAAIAVSPDSPPC